MLKKNIKLKNIILIIFLILTCVYSKYTFASNDGGKIGFGFILGDPIGLTAQTNLSEKISIDAGFGDSRGDGFYLYGDLLLNLHNFSELNGLGFYVGIGPGFQRYEVERKNKEDKEENIIEVRVPIGIDYAFNSEFDVPVTVFVEFTPALQLAPEIDSEFRGGIGARYFF